MANKSLSARLLSAESPVFFIAEAGVNHNGDVAMAKRLIDAAKEAGADCVKFQTFKASEITTAGASKANYQLKSTDPKESHFDMLKKLELPEAAFADLKRHCERQGIFFMSTPYNFPDVDLLERIGVEAYKIASGQLTESPFISYVAQKKKPMILSTGMSSLDDVAEAVKTVRAAGNDQMILLQCTTNYPSRPEDCHLRAMKTMNEQFHVPIGYSDHTQGNLAILGAVAMGARVIEKHFTLDRQLPGPDHSCSLEPREMAELIKEIRALETMLGRPEKKPSAAELENARSMKRSLASTQFIPKGTKLTREMVTFKRPASGIAPRELTKVIGSVTLQDIPADTVLKTEMIK
jgi:N,N'-diacetyllegionaminate synthase